MNATPNKTETSAPTDCTKRNTEQIEIFQVENKPVVVEKSAIEMSSNAGFLLLGQLERKHRFVEQLSGVFRDAKKNRAVKNEDRIEHSLVDLMKQRVFQIALGYEDGLDANALRWDRALQMSVNKDEVLGSQPMMSRLENWVSRRDLYLGFRELVKIYAKEFYVSGSIVLHIDSTNDPVHGQLGMFNGYYEEHCFHPLLITEEKSSFPLAVILREGHVSSAKQSKAVLQRLICWLKLELPGVHIVVKGDGAFGVCELIEWFDEQGVDYMLGLTGNAVLWKETKDLQTRVQKDFERDHAPLQNYQSLSYKAGTWQSAHSVVAKVEHTGKGLNQRFVVSSMMAEDPEALYASYLTRCGGIESIIEEFKRGLRFDKTACHKKLPNQMRYLENILAYLFHLKIKEKVASKLKEVPTVQTLIQQLLKVAAIVKSSVRRFLIQLPASDPNTPLLMFALSG